MKYFFEENIGILIKIQIFYSELTYIGREYLI